jgi:predicted ATP-dependent serine protease
MILQDMPESDPSRREAAAKIKAEPAKYKVCESCGSIVAKKASTCPNCNAYRFDTRVESVQAQAEALATRSPLSIEKQDYA